MEAESGGCVFLPQERSAYQMPDRAVAGEQLPLGEKGDARGNALRRIDCRYGKENRKK